MKGKIIVITGATRGIGLELKKILSADNTVVSFSRSEAENGVTSFRADVSDREEVKRVFDDIGRLYGKIDVLINNAGYGLSGATETLPENEIRRITDVNFLGPIWCVQCALPYMKDGAKIAFVSSASGFTPMPYRTMYNCTKSALTMLSYSLKNELNKFNIDCTAFILGPVNTGFASNRVAIESTDAKYASDVKKVDDFVKRQKPTSKMSVTRTAEYMIKKLNGRRLKYHYIVGLPFRLAYVAYKIAPFFTFRVTDKVMEK